MRDQKKELDPKKIAIVKACLEKAFKDIRHRQEGKNDLQVFVVPNGTKRSQLVITRGFFDDLQIQNEELLRAQIETRIIPKLKANPGKHVSLSRSGIEVFETGDDEP